MTKLPVSIMAMSIANTYSPLYHYTRTTSRLSQISLSKSMPIHLKSKRNSSALITNCFTSNVAKDPIKFPFLLVDRMVEYTRGGVTAVGIKNFTINEYFFSGHFPSKPIVPGVILIEAMAQVGGILIQPETGRKYVYFVGIDKVRFKKQVVAGGTLVMRMTTIRAKKHLGIVKLEGKAYVGGEIVCEGEFLAMAQDGGLILLQTEVAGPHEEVWFRKPVVSGDTLVLRMAVFKLHKRLTLEGKAYVEGELVCKADFFYITW